MALSLANVTTPALTLSHETANIFPSGPTYAMLAAFVVLFLTLTVIWYRRVPAASSQTAEWFLTAGRNMKSGIVAASIACTWTWAATLMVSSAKGYEHGIAGPYWYAAGATIPLLLFAVLAIHLKRRAPMAHTFGEFVWHRFGGPSHRLMLCLGLLTCVIVTAMVVMGGAYALRTLTGLDVRLTVLLIPLAFAFYSVLGGLRGSIVVEYVQMMVLLGIALALTLWFWSGQGDLGIFERLRALPAREGEDYLTLASLPALLFGIVNTIGNFGTVFMDQTYWQRAIAASGTGAGRSFLIGGLAWFAIPFGIATAFGVGGLALGVAVPPPYTDIASAMAAAAFGPLGSWLFLIMLFMAIISTGNAESIAVASLVATDIYKTYVRPQASDGDILRVARWSTLTFALLIGPICLALHVLTIDMEWLYMAVGIFVGAGIIPLALGLLTDRLTGRGAYWATLGGLAMGLVAWVAAAHQIEGAITITTLGRMIPLAIGNLTVILTSALICGIDCARPHAGFRFDQLLSATRSYLSLPADAGAAGLHPHFPATLCRQERRVIRWVVGLAVLLELIVPGGLYLSGIQFGQELFAVWVILSLVWLLLATGFIVLLPIKDHYETAHAQQIGVHLPPAEQRAPEDSIGNRLFLAFLTVVLMLGIGAVVSLVKLGSLEYLRGVNERIILEEDLHEDMVLVLIPQALEERRRGEQGGLAASALSARAKLLATSPHTPPLLRAMIVSPEANDPIPYLKLEERERVLLASSIAGTYRGTRLANVSQMNLQQRQAIALILLSLGSTLAVGLLLTIRTSAAITRPIQRLAEASRRFTAGEPPVPPVPVETDDEVGVLTEEFNMMAMRIREQVAALQTAEQEFRMIISHVNDAILYLDVEGCIRWGNSQACVLLGRQPEKILGLPIMSVLTSKSAALAAERLAAIRHGGSVPPLVELGIVHPDGTVVLVEANAASVRKDGKIVGRLLVFRDITRRKHADASLRESERRTRAILAAALDAVVGMDAHGSVTYWNPRSEAIFGWTQSEAVGRKMSDLIIPPQYRDAHERGLRHFFATGKGPVLNQRIEITALRRDGTEFPVELAISASASDDSYQFIAFIADITKRKQSENALRESEAFKNRILESSPDCIKVLDLEGRLLFMSKGGMERLEISDITPFLNCQWAEFWKGGDKQNAHAAIETARAGGVGRFQGFYQTATGKPQWWDVFITPLPNSSGQPDKLLAISRDITKRKQSENALRESEQQLRHLFEDRDRMARDLHDNIIQSLYAIGMGLEECQRLIKKNSALAVRMAGSAIAGLNAVIRDVRQYIKGLEPQFLSGRQLRAELAELVRTMEAPHLLRFRLIVDPAAAARLTSEDAYHVVCVVREAMSNSLRHSHAKTGAVSLLQQNGGIRLEVSDDGAGFDMHTDRAGGEGLHNMATRAQKLGARLEIVAQRGQGVRVILDIPLECEHG